MKEILEEKIFYEKIDFTLKEALNIAKMDFHQLIINVIKKRDIVIVDENIIKALDSYLMKEEDQEIR